jgi:hypothetical protein
MSFKEEKLKWKLKNYKSRSSGKYGLGADPSNFLDLIGDRFYLSEDERELIGRKAKLVWSDRQFLFGTNTSYENILLGITLYFFEFWLKGSEMEYDSNIEKDPKKKRVYERAKRSETEVYCAYSEKMLKYIKEMNEENFQKNKISIYNIYQTLKDLFSTDDSVKSILIQSFNLTKSEEENFYNILETLLPKKRAFFNRIHSENIFLGAIICVKEVSDKYFDAENIYLEIDDAIKFIHKDDHEEHLNEVQDAYQMIKKLSSTDLNY